MTSKGEEECRRVLEDIFDMDFYSYRPKFLKNPDTNHNLEIDCYNHELKIACEYHGKQHYEYPNGFHKTEEEFVRAVCRDRFKRKVLHDNGIYFIEVPYSIELDQIKDFIILELQNYFQWVIDIRKNI